MVVVQGEVKRFFIFSFHAALPAFAQRCRARMCHSAGDLLAHVGRRRGAVQCLRGPLAADSPPDWANSVGMRGCVCHGMLPQPHCMDTARFFSPLHVSPLPHRRHCRHPQVVSQRQERSVMGAKPRRAATRRSMIPTVLERTRKSGTHRRVLGLVVGAMMRGEFIWWLFLKRGSRACGSNISRSGTAKVSHSSSTWVPLPLAQARLPAAAPWVFCPGTCLSH